MRDEFWLELAGKPTASEDAASIYFVRNDGTTALAAVHWLKTISRESEVHFD